MPGYPVGNCYLLHPRSFRKNSNSRRLREGHGRGSRQVRFWLAGVDRLGDRRSHSGIPLFACSSPQPSPGRPRPVQSLAGAVPPYTPSHHRRSSVVRNHALPTPGRRSILRCPQRNVNVFKQHFADDAPDALRRLHQIVARPPRLFTVQCIDKSQRIGELTRAYQKSRAINRPSMFRIHILCFHPCGRFGVLSGFIRPFSLHGPANSSREPAVRWSDFTRVNKVGQYHKNCATVEFQSANDRCSPGMKLRSKPTAVHARALGFAARNKTLAPRPPRPASLICTTPAQDKNSSPVRDSSAVAVLSQLCLFLVLRNRYSHHGAIGASRCVLR